MAMMTSVQTDEKLGFVYVIERGDLTKCYVGQSVRDCRPSMHLKPGTYQFDELCGDGVVPTVVTGERLHARGDALDEAERSEMLSRQAAGWVLVNRMGPDDVWPMVPFEFASAGGKKGIENAWKTMRERMENDPEWVETWKASHSAGMVALHQRRAKDSEFDQHCRAAWLEAGLRGAETRRAKRATDPEWAAQEKENARKGGLKGGHNGGKVTASIKTRCLGCDKISTPGGIGMHQSASGHTGRVILTSSRQGE